MKKRCIIYGSAASLFLCYFAFIGHGYFVGEVTEADLDQLEDGMSKWRVRMVLGRLPDASYQLIKGQTHEDWVGDDGTIMVAFDENNQLIWKAWNELKRRPSLRERWHGLFYKVRE